MTARPEQPVIAVEGLTHRYPGMERDALHAVDFHVASGSLAGLLGPNGAGKSTLLAILNGVTSLQKGCVSIVGRTPADRGWLKSASSLVPQACAFYDTLTTRENLAFFAGVHGLTGARWRDGLAYCVNVADLSGVLNQRAGTLSGGLQRRLNLAIGLINRPRILYLDEPTVGVDAESRQCITAAIATLRRDGTTIVYTSHYMEEVETLCDHLTVIDQGRTVAAGATDELLARFGGTSMAVTLQGLPDGSLAEVLQPWSPVWLDARTVRLEASDTATATAIMRVLDAQGVVVERVHYGVERLEDVYLRLLGRRGDS